MHSKTVFAVILGILCLLAFTGCGGGSGGSGNSYASSWLGTTSNANSSDPASIDIRPSSVTVKPGQSISLAILVKNAFGQPIDGANLQLASVLGGTFEDQTGRTTKGWFSTRFTAGKQVGTEAITAIANGEIQSKPILVQATTAEQTTLSIITSSDSTLAETPVTVVVSAKVDGLNAENETVALSSTIPGRFSDSSGEINQGWFSTSFTPDSSAAGIGTLTALVNGVFSNCSLSVVKTKKEAPELKITLNPDAVFQDQTCAVIVSGVDSKGFPSDATVYLSATLNGTFDRNSGSLSEGLFFTEFTAGKEVGSATITVFSTGDASASTILSIERPTIVAKISPSSDKLKIGEKIPVSVLVTDTFSRPITGSEVHLLANNGCTCNPDQETTNSDGYIFFELEAGSTAGITTITALTAGASDTADVTVFGP